MLDTKPVRLLLISSTALSVSTESFLTSSATTAKPFPASPALAASMEALSARRLIWLAIPETMDTI